MNGSQYINILTDMYFDFTLIKSIKLFVQDASAKSSQLKIHFLNYNREEYNVVQTVMKIHS